MARTLRLLVLPAGVASLLVVAAEAQLDLSYGQRSADGTAYQVITVPPGLPSSGVDYMRVTTVAGGINGLTECSSSGSGPGQGTSAVAGADPSLPQTLHPYSAVLRTGILMPDSLSPISFSPVNGGRLTVGSGTTAINICRDPADCIGAANVAPTFALSDSGGGVPAACIASTLAAGCAGNVSAQTFAFGLPAAGDPPVCATPPTTSTQICDPAPLDGFTLGNGQLIVFLYNHNLPHSGFTTAAGAFGVENHEGPICGLDAVVTADAQGLSIPPPAPPSPTPTPTATPTATATATITPLPENCTDGIDNDGDGLVDCDDELDCPCQPLIRDPAHLCPAAHQQLSRYSLHARAYPVADIGTIESDGLTFALQYHATAPWFRFHIPASALHIKSASWRGIKYTYVDKSSGPGIKKLTLRKTYRYGQLQYLINFVGMTPHPPIAGRYDLVQQINLGAVPFASTQSWRRSGRCLTLPDRLLQTSD